MSNKISRRTASQKLRYLMEACNILAQEEIAQHDFETQLSFEQDDCSMRVDHDRMCRALALD